MSDRIVVGLTYDLKTDYLQQGYSDEEVAELDKEETIEGIENSLHKLGYATERIGHIKNLSKLLNLGKRWDIVFNLAEGMYGIGREAQIPALLDAYNISYTFSNPLTLALSLHKGMTKQVIRDAKVPTPDFYVVEKISDIERIKIPFPLFAKPVAEGSGKGVNENSIIGNKEQLFSVCKNLLYSFRENILVEKFLPGREFTVGIIGTGDDSEAVGVMEVIFKKNPESNAYSYFNKQNYQNHVDYKMLDGKLADECRKVSLAAWKALGCRDSGRIDLRLDEREVPNFIEVNPLAGLNYKDSDLPILCRLSGIDFDELISRIMKSAMKRNLKIGLSAR